MPEDMVCRILAFMWSCGPLVGDAYQSMYSRVVLGLLMPPALLLGFREKDVAKCRRDQENFMLIEGSQQLLWCLYLESHTYAIASCALCMGRWFTYFRGPGSSNPRGVQVLKQ